MSNAIKCDTCGTALPTDAEALMDWMRVEYGIGRMNTNLEDFCSLDCLENGVEEEIRFREATRAEVAELAES